MLAACKVIRSESGAPSTTPILLEGDRCPLTKTKNTAHEKDRSGIGAPFSDIITYEENVYPNFTCQGNSFFFQLRTIYTNGVNQNNNIFHYYIYIL